MASTKENGRVASQKQTRLFIGAFLFLCFVALSISLTLLFIEEISVAHYPGAEEMSTHVVTNGLAQLHLRRDMSYKSSDDFLTVRRWYTTKFGLDSATGGAAHNNCVMMEGARELLWLKRHMNVMVCNNDQFQRIFIKRSLYIGAR